MVGQRARQVPVKADEYQKNFVPYGTPCRDIHDPARNQVDYLQCEVKLLQEQVKMLMEERHKHAHSPLLDGDAGQMGNDSNDNRNSA